MLQLRNALTIVLTLAALPAIAGSQDARVVCIAGTPVKAGCDGVMQRLDQDLFLKRWPTDHAISITTQRILPTTANIAVNAGTLHVIKVIRNGKEIGTKPVFVIQLSRDTDNLSDGAPEDLGAQNVGWSLANALNKALASGATADK